MTDPRTESDQALQLIDDLTGDLPPVARIPRLRVGFARVLVLVALVSALTLLLSGVRPDLAERIADHPGYVAILVGLVLLAGGGILASLAASIPGRDGVVRVGLLLAAVGLFVAVLLGTALSLGWTPAPPPVSISTGAGCVGIACLLALAPGIALLAYVVRAAPFRPTLVAAAGLAGVVAAGALVVHLTCPASELSHLVLSHALAPALATLLLIAPFRAVVRRAESV